MQYMKTRSVHFVRKRNHKCFKIEKDKARLEPEGKARAGKGYLYLDLELIFST